MSRIPSDHDQGLLLSLLDPFIDSPVKCEYLLKALKDFAPPFQYGLEKKGVKRLTWQKEDLSKDRLLLSAPDMLIRRRCLENIKIYWQL